MAASHGRSLRSNSTYVQIRVVEAILDELFSRSSLVNIQSDICQYELDSKVSWTVSVDGWKSML